MTFATIKLAGGDAIRSLRDRRSRYQMTGEYPFLIGDREELERVKEAAEFNKQDPVDIVQTSLASTVAEWVARRQLELDEDGFSPDDLLGEWPGEILEKGSIGLHKDIVSGKIRPEVYLGLANIDEPWKLPAALKYGAWNDCPEAEAHCAFHREWQVTYGAEITGISGDVIECVVSKPPISREEAIELAWQQYWYCSDIVDQGCESISNLAATLLNSPYWYFWWD